MSTPNTLDTDDFEAIMEQIDLAAGTLDILGERQLPTDAAGALDTATLEQIDRAAGTLDILSEHAQPKGVSKSDDTWRESRGYCLVVVPTYNEALNIERLIGEILAQGRQFDVLVVDDGSPDGTGDLVAAIAQQTPRVQLIRRSGKLGLGTAYVAGFREGLRQGYHYLCEMDADFSHQPRYLPVLLAVAERAADVALGSRNVTGGRVENWSWERKLISKGGSLYARSMLGMPVRDCTGGYKCFRAGVLEQIDLESIGSNGYAFQVEMNYRCHQAGFRLHEIPIVFPDRVAGQSKMSQQIVWEAAAMVLRLRFSPNPYKGLSFAEARD